MLHNENGPAIVYPDGWSVWALNGVAVTEEIVEATIQTMTKEWLQEHFIAETNAEVRREIVRKLGADLLCTRLGYKVLDKRDGYELVTLDIKDENPRPYLRMENPSIDAIHIEGVHPDCKTVDEALLFRNGITKDQIDDENGSEWFQQGDVLLFKEGATTFKSRPKKIT